MKIAATSMSRIFLATFSLLFLAVHAHAQNTSIAGAEATAIYIANWTSSDVDNLNSLEWLDITSDPRRESRIGDDHCMLVKKVTVKTDSSGTWWSDWCRVGGAQTNRKGDYIGVTTSQQRSTTIHSDIKITVPMLSSLKVKVGASVTKTVGWAQSYGCTNVDGIRHGLWLQENIGWAWQTITEKFTQSGPSWCRPAPATHVHHEQINWPDPKKTGSRQIQYQCQWDNVGGRQCDFWNPKYL